MEVTKNVSLEKPAMSHTFEQWLEAMNGNSDRLDKLPLPVAYGGNNQMEYLKLANGTIAMWGHIEHGKNYPCTTPWDAAAGYASKEFTITYPVALVDDSPTVFAIATADVNPDTWVLKRSQGYTSFTGCYLCAVEETRNAKQCDLFVLGKWK